MIEGREDLAHDEEKENLHQSRYAPTFLCVSVVSWRIFCHLLVVCVFQVCVYLVFVNNLQFIFVVVQLLSLV